MPLPSAPPRYIPSGVCWRLIGDAFQPFLVYERSGRQAGGVRKVKHLELGESGKGPSEARDTGRTDAIFAAGGQGKREGGRESAAPPSANAKKIKQPKHQGKAINRKVLNI